MLIQTSLSKSIRSLTYKYLLNNLKLYRHNNVNNCSIYKKALSLSLSMIVALLSFSTTGCTTLEALEPTAALINDLKKIL